MRPSPQISSGKLLVNWMEWTMPVWTQSAQLHKEWFCWMIGLGVQCSHPARCSAKLLGHAARLTRSSSGAVECWFEFMVREQHYVNQQVATELRLLGSRSVAERGICLAEFAESTCALLRTTTHSAIRINRLLTEPWAEFWNLQGNGSDSN